jgi:phasin family protein
MFNAPEQFSNATKASLESQLAMFTALTGKAIESVEKVIELNLTAVKASMEDTSITAKQLLAAKDPQEFFSLTAAQAQPNAAKAIAYARHLGGITTGFQAELTRAGEEHIAETSRKVSALFDDVSKNAPAGSENVIALFKTALGNANAGYEQFTKSTKQAAEVVEANMSAAVSQFTQAAEKTAAAGRTRK